MTGTARLKIFVCWSGERGRQFAVACQTWLNSLFDNQIETEISVEIEKGAVWFVDLTDALRGSRIGIICLTPEGVDSPWVHFEAGMLATIIHKDDTAASATTTSSPRLLPFLLNVQSALVGPLGAYQGTSATDKDDAWRLVEAIAAVLPEPLDSTALRVLGKRYREGWTDFQSSLSSIRPIDLRKVVPQFWQWFDRKTFNESMHDCISQSWLDRYNGARDTASLLRSNQRTVRSACGRFVGDVYDALVIEADGYANGLSKLIGKKEVPLENGRLAFGAEAGVAEVCERRRSRIRSLVAILEPDSQRPFCEEAFRFELAETIAQKRQLIHRRANEIRLNREKFSDEMNMTRGIDFKNPTKKSQMRICEWALDRIVYYAWVSETNQEVTPAELIASARFELDQASNERADPHHFGLAYVLQLLTEKLRCSAEAGETPELRRLFGELEQFQKLHGLDDSASIRRLIEELGARTRPPVTRAIQSDVALGAQVEPAS